MTTNLERAATVSRNVQIQSVTLAGANLQTNVDPLAVPEELELTQEYRSTVDVKETRPDHLYVTVDFKFTAEEGSEESPGANAIELEASYLVVYALKNASEYAEDALEHFAWLNGAYNAWPYWRELVQTVSGRVGIASVVVPVFRPPIRDLSEEEEQQLRLAVEDAPE